MSWLKVSDAFAMHPMLLQVMEYPKADDRLLNEFAGFLIRCSTSAAAYETDYVITKGMVSTLAGSYSRNQVLCDLALKIGIFTAMKDPKGRIVYKLIEEEDLVHMILKAERLWRNRRKEDNRNPKLTAPVRKRDGDDCRWCGQRVEWKDRKSHRGATYDHLNPGQGSTSPEDLVVCCRSCNSARRDDAPSWNRQLLAPPEKPYYSQETVTFLAKNNIMVTPSDSLPVEVAGAEPTVSLVPVDTAEVVDPAQVEPAAVEPEKLAPVATTPQATVPTASSSSCPVEPVAVEPTVEPEKSAPVAAPAPTAPGLDPVEQQLRQFELDIAEGGPEASERSEVARQARSESHKKKSGRYRQKSTVTDLDMPGRVGTGLEITNHKRTLETSEPGGSVPKPRKPRRRRRRRKKKSNAEAKKG